MGASSVTGKGTGEAGITRGPGNGRNQFHSILDPVIATGFLAVGINYSVGGVVWTFSSVFNQLPIINVSIILKNLVDSIFPICPKIISLTTSSVTIKAYKSLLDAHNDIVFSECDSNDVTLHITANINADSQFCFI